ncbi:hypothetical protein A3D11_02835 [Candidatus Peribacteria bacterium RIFCSPHIGHO2_02_FULL_49_16]|nr:MAG: hypothetical protein A3D11_02835 [Candidatus Peribacteria bacterium RIFCSPHIGHO2_02_FULL_49_16]
MLNLSSPINHTFAPHVDTCYVFHALWLAMQPWKWRKGKEQEKLREALEQYFDADVTLFASGREALLALLQSLKVKEGDEVIVQGYTCTVIPNAIHATGAQPVYADIDPETLNLTKETVEPLISNRTRAIICQHTFGIPADTEKLRTLCDEYAIPLIEDCAHIIPDVKGPKEIGKYGDYLFLSFGRDKAISGIAGGALVRKGPRMAGKFHMPNTFQMPHSKTIRLLLYPLIYSFARPLYGIGIGKMFLWLCGKLGLLVPIMTNNEKKGHMVMTFHEIPNAIAGIAVAQFQKLQLINDHRRILTQLYLQACKDNNWKTLDGITEDLPLQKFPLFIQNADSIRNQFKKYNIHLHDGWTGCTIITESVHAKTIEKHILNLPTHPTMTNKQAQKLIRSLKNIHQ